MVLLVNKDMFEQIDASIVFDPIPTYNGMWFFNIDNLLKNADKDKLNSFYNETYIKPLSELIGEDNCQKNKVNFVSMPNNEEGRCLRYSKKEFYKNLLLYLNQRIDRYGLNEDDNKKRIKDLINAYNSNDDGTLNIKFAQAFKEKTIKIKDVMDNEIESKYFDVYMEDYNKYEHILNFKDYISVNYINSLKYQTGLLKLNGFFDKNLDYNKLASCFEKDKFYLLFAKILLNNNIGYNYLFDYNKVINNCEIKYIAKNSMKTLYYTNNNFHDEFSNYVYNNNIEYFDLPIISNNKKNYKNINIMKKIYELYNNRKESNWLIIDNNNLLNEINDDYFKQRLKVILNTDYIVNLKGINELEGYYVYIYGNDKVVIERYYNNKELINEVTYITNIDNFIKNLKRADIGNYMKEINDDTLSRIYHTNINNYTRCLNNAIYGKYHLDDAINFINSFDNVGGN